jgi:hypothetical protein
MVPQSPDAQPWTGAMDGRADEASFGDEHLHVYLSQVGAARLRLLLRYRERELLQFDADDDGSNGVHWNRAVAGCTTGNIRS